MTDYTALQQAADALAAQAVAQATAPLVAQIGQLQTSLAAAVQADVTDRASLVKAQQQIVALQGQLAVLSGGIPPAPSGYRVVLADDFTGASLDGSKWTATTDTASNELSARLPANVLVGPDRLSIIAKRQQVGARQFSSGYVTTAGHSSIPVGKWLIRARWDDLFGVWPAIWLRFDDKPDGTKVLGEIDIMEAVGTVRGVVQTVHQSTNGDQDKSGYDWLPPAGWSCSDWHVYGLERRADGSLLWTVDGTLTRAVNISTLGSVSRQPMTWLTGPTFTGPAHLIINLQIGGSMVNYAINGDTKVPVDPTRILPGATTAHLDIDWVQVLAPASA